MGYADGNCGECFIAINFALGKTDNPSHLSACTTCQAARRPEKFWALQLARTLAALAEKPLLIEILHEGQRRKRGESETLASFPGGAQELARIQLEIADNVNWLERNVGRGLVGARR